MEARKHQARTEQHGHDDHEPRQRRGRIFPKPAETRRRKLEIVIHTPRASTLRMDLPGRKICEKGLAAGVKVDDVMRNMDESKKRNQLMERLGVKQQSVRDRSH